MKQSNLYRWVKASERFPLKWNMVHCIYKGIPLKRLIDVGENNYPETFDENISIDIESLEWMEEIESIQQAKAEEILSIHTGLDVRLIKEAPSGVINISKALSAMEEYANQFKGSVPVSEEPLIGELVNKVVVDGLNVTELNELYIVNRR